MSPQHGASGAHSGQSPAKPRPMSEGWICFEACAKSVSAEGQEAPVQPAALKAECFPFCSQGDISISCRPQKQAEGCVHTANGEMFVN